jgi:hypothetical protein
MNITHFHRPAKKLFSTFILLCLLATNSRFIPAASAEESPSTVVVSTASDGIQGGFLDWNTFLGGGDSDSARSSVVDGSGNIYITGESYASWGTPVNSFSTGPDVYVAKLDSSGALVWNTFLGGTDWDGGYDIAVDGNGNVYVTGISYATWGTPLHDFAGNSDAFVAKLSSNGTKTWHTFLGGIGNDNVFSIAIGASGKIYVSGDSDISWGTPINAHAGSNDAFVAKLDINNGALLWHTFMGGTDREYGTGIAVDGSENVYVNGQGYASWGTPVNEFAGGLGDAFIVKLNSSGARVWNTFLGGGGWDLGYGIALDGNQNIYVVGTSVAMDTSDASWGTPLRGFTGFDDAFVAKLDANGSLAWNTFLGGNGSDGGIDIALDRERNVYIAGSSTHSWGTPLRPISASGFFDAFAVGLNPSGALIWNTFLGGNADDGASGIVVDGSGTVYVAGSSSTSWGTPLHAFAGGNDAFVAKLSESEPDGVLNITVILARASDGPDPDPEHNSGYFSNIIIPKVTRLHVINSYGEINIHLQNVVTADGGWITLDRTLAEYQAFGDLKEREFVLDAIDAAVQEGMTPITADHSIIVVVHTGTSQQRPPYNSSDFKTQTDSLVNGIPWIIVSEDDPIGPWAHEIGHDLGVFLKGDFLPHPYPLAAAICNSAGDECNPHPDSFWDLMTNGSWAGNPPNQGSTPTYMSSISKQFLGLIGYERMNSIEAINMGARWVPAVEVSQEDTLNIGLDIETHCYVIETRAKDPPHGFGEISVPSSGLVIYDIYSHGFSECGEMTRTPNGGDSLENIVVKAVLHPGSSCPLFPISDPNVTESCLNDWSNNISLIAAEEDSSINDYRIRVEFQPAVNPLSEVVKGVVISTGEGILRVLPELSATLLPQLGEGNPLPDIDLHLYTDDGRHIGVNYATGEYEHQNIKAETVGDQLNSEEWIVVPESTSSVHFIVSYIDAVRFLQAFPNLQSALGSADTIQIKGIGALPGDTPIKTDSVNLTVPVGGVVEIKVDTQLNPDGSLGITLVQSAVTIDSIIVELDSYYKMGAIKNFRAYSGLRDKLLAAKISIQSGNTKVAIKQLTAFKRQLNADQITNPFARQALVRDTQTLINILSQE